MTSLSAERTVQQTSPEKGVRMAERSKALRSGRSPLLWAWVRIPLLTCRLFYPTQPSEKLVRGGASRHADSRVAQWKRAGPITQRSVDRNHALLVIFICGNHVSVSVSVRWCSGYHVCFTRRRSPVRPWHGSLSFCVYYTCCQDGRVV